jgi:two-component sensor histidine kinase
MSRTILCESADFPLTVGQGTSLALLVSELVSNAMKHGHGDVSLTLKAQGQEAHLTVSDDGPGFREDFDWRTAANTGLSLVNYTGRHDLRGTVVYGNKPAGGGCVTVSFPISEDGSL